MGVIFCVFLCLLGDHVNKIVPNNFSNDVIVSREEGGERQLCEFAQLSANTCLKLLVGAMRFAYR